MNYSTASEVLAVMYGELIPMGGGDTIPLLKKKLKVGRRESCDIVLRFANVSAHHCQLTLNGGYWYVRDLDSRNGTKVNDVRVSDKRVDPGAVISVAKHRYEIRYSPLELGAVGPPPPDDSQSVIMGESLLAKAGLKKEAKQFRDHTERKRFDPSDLSAGQIKDPNKPV